MAKQLLITADDYGVHSVIDKGIKKCVDAGIVDCIDVIVAHHSSKWRIRRLLKEYKGKFESGELKLGLHLSLTCGSPLYRNSDAYLNKIAKKKKFKSIKRWVFKHNTALQFIRDIDDLEDNFLHCLEKEMIAQFKKFIEITGQPPQHISSHTGVFQSTDKIYAFYSRFCKEYNIPMRCPTLLGLDESMPEWKSKPKQEMFPQQHINELLLLENGHKAWCWMKNEIKPAFLLSKLDGVSSTDFFIEHFYNQTKKEDKQKEIMINILNKIGNHSYEMVIHPVLYRHISEYRKSKVPGISAKNFGKRKTETLTLIKHNFREEMKSLGINKYPL